MKSKSLRFRILLLLVGTTAIAALICGIIGYYNSRAVADSDAKEKLTTVSEGYGKDIDNLLSQVEVAVNTLADVTKKSDSGCRQVQKQQQLRGFLYGGVRDYSSSVCE